LASEQDRFDAEAVATDSRYMVSACWLRCSTQSLLGLAPLPAPLSKPSHSGPLALGEAGQKGWLLATSRDSASAAQLQPSLSAGLALILLPP